MAERGGFRAVPYAMEAELRAVAPAQRAVLISLAFQAQWTPADVDVDGVRVRLDVGEALVSSRGLAVLLRLGDGSRGASLARRAIESGRRIGLIATRAARPTGDAPLGAPRGARGDAPRSAPCDAPPTIVRFLRHRGILWQASESDAPPDAPRGARGDVPGDAQGDAIPQGTAPQDTGTGHRRSRPSPLFSVSEIAGGAGGDGSKEGLFRSLFVGCPDWIPVRQMLTTQAAQALEGEALTVCADLLARGVSPDAEPEVYRREALELLARYRRTAARKAKR
jgi:hypothetical protein